jgi:hypothetical protein
MASEVGDKRITPFPFLRCHGHRFQRRRHRANHSCKNIDSLPIALSCEVVGDDHHIDIANSRARPARMGCKYDELVKSRKTPFFVIPAEAGIQSNQVVLDPGVRRGDGLGDFLRSRQIICLQNCIIFCKYYDHERRYTGKKSSGAISAQEYG